MWENRTISHFITKYLIGQGSYSLVYKAVDTRTQQEVALKHVTVQRGADVVEAHYRGAQVQELLSDRDDRVVKIYSFERWNDDLLIAMENVTGDKLSAPQPVERAVEIAKDIYEVLEKAHNISGKKGDTEFNAIVHGDLKPENIILTDTGKIKILDFGSAKELQKSGKATRGEFGTVAYCSPERIRDVTLSHHVDLWAAGIILYEMLVGKLPYPAEVVENTERLERTIRNCRRVQFPTDIDYPPILKKIVTKILAPDIQHRYQTAKQVLDDLEAFQQGRPTMVEGESEEIENQSVSTTGQPTSAPDNGSDTKPTQRTDLPGHGSVKGKNQTSAGVTSNLGSGDTNATVRTDQGSEEYSKVDASIKPIGSAKRSKVIGKIVLGIFSTVLLLAGVIFLVLWLNEQSLSKEAATLAKQMDSGQLTDVDKAWNSYNHLVSQSRLGFGPSPAVQPLKKLLKDKANKILANYLDDIPTIRESDYKASRTYLEHVLELDAGDQEAKALVAYCNGHIHRINAEARKGDGKLEEANSLFNEAIREFKNAASIKPEWSEPHLGMARIYILGLDDMVNGSKELGEAGKYGHPPGKRDKWILAKGYCRSGQKLRADSTRATDSSLKKDLLLKAKQDYEQCISGYQGIVPFADVINNLNTAQSSLRQIEEALESLEAEQNESDSEDTDSPE